MNGPGPSPSTPGLFSRRKVLTTPEIESARIRLQAILSELEQACSGGENTSIQLLHEMHAITRFLHECGYVIKTVRQGSKLIVEVDPLAAVKEYEWTA
jgi:hypothetical protein